MPFYQLSLYFLLIGCLILLASGCQQAPPNEAPSPQAQGLLTQLQQAYAQGDWNRALALADSTALVAPRQALVPFIQGQIFTSLKRFDEAEAAFEQALAWDPTLRRAWYHRGHNAFLQRQYREALAFYRKEQALLSDAVSPSSTSPTVDLAAIAAQIGRTYALLGIPDSAHLSYQQSLALDSTNVVAHAWLGEWYENQGQLSEALHHAQRALEGNPQEVGYAYQVGFLLFQTGRFEEAALLLSAVVQQWPGHEGASYNLGRTLMALGQEEQGQAYLDRVDDIQQLQEQALLAQRAVEVHPDDPQRWIELARLMMQIGYFDRAEEAFTAALAQAPQNRALLNDWANLAIVRGDTTQALQRFQSLLQQDPTFAAGWLNLGIIYAMTGQPEAARTAWERVLQLNPADPDAQAYIDLLEQQ